MKKIFSYIVILSAIIILSGCAKQIQPQNNSSQSIPDQPNTANDEKSCQKDTDCACGRHIDTKQCFYGNAKYVDPALKPCPDFCSGIGGGLTIKCVSNECQQVRQ